MIKAITLEHEGTLGKPAVELHAANAFEADIAMLQLKGMRDQAASNYQQYDVMGRNAMIELMARVYRVWFDARNSKQFEGFVTKMKQTLTKNGAEFRATSKDSSLLIRYVFKHFDHKQVSVYGRSLAGAFKKGIAPDDFAAFINRTEGGFSGVRIADTPRKTGGAEPISADVAVTHVKAERTITTIEVTDWQEDEDVRVLVAVRNDDDTASLKNARLSEDSVKAVLLRYEADKKERSKPPKDKEAEDKRHALKALEGDVANAKVDCGNIEADLSVALEYGDAAKCDVLRVNLTVAQVKAKAIERAYKALKEGLEAPSAA